MQNKLKDLRKARGITQTWLSRKSGVCRATIWKIESGNRCVINTSTLKRLAEALGVKEEDIFFD